jgi:hypothetical protein
MNNKQIIIIGGIIIVGAVALLVFIVVSWKLWKNKQANISISSTPRWSTDSGTISALTDDNTYTDDPNPYNYGGKHRRNKRKKRYLKN